MGLGQRGVDMDHAQELAQEDIRHVLVVVATRHGTTLVLIVHVGIAVNMTQKDVILAPVHPILDLHAEIVTFNQHVPSTAPKVICLLPVLYGEKDVPGIQIQITRTIL